MAHQHTSDASNYWADQLCMVGSAGALGVISLLMWQSDKLDFLAPFFRWAVLFGAFLFGLGSVGIIPPSRAAVAGVVFGYAYVRTGSTGLVILGHVLTALLTALLG